MVWKGVIIEESLRDKSLLDLVEVVRTEEFELEKTGEITTFHMYQFEDEKSEEFFEKALSALRDGKWYLHSVKDNRMTVIYHGKRFDFKKGERKKIEKARRFGLSKGIPKEQMPFEKLIEDPYA